MIYLDNAATMCPIPEAVETFLESVKMFGNPSSMHSFGYNCRLEIEKHRKTISKLISCDSSEIYFTSGGTESNNIAILGALSAMNKHSKIITSPTEHPSVLEPSLRGAERRGNPASLVNILPNGTIDLNHLESLLTADIALVSIMHVNNETGSINPIDEAYKMVKNKSNAIFHVDNVQGFGKINHINADLISFSAHKIGGLKGIGGLYVKNGVRIKPIIFGGGQEKELRSGTESLPLIASFAKVCEVIFEKALDNYCKVQGLDNIITKELSAIKNTHLNSDDSCSPYILNIRFDDVMGETLLHCLERHEIYIGIGSACSSHGTRPSETLKAMGLNNKQIKESIRISFSPQNTIAEVKKACEIIINEVANLRGIKK